MAFNGTGTFLRVRNWMQDAAANIRIRADRHDSEDDNFAQGLSQCITKDGQTTVTNNLPMANYRHTNVGAAQAINQYARYDQVQLGKAVWAVAGGTADALTASYSPATTAPVDGQLYYVRATAANATTTPTFAPDGETAQIITKYGVQALEIGDIAGDGHELILRYRLADTKYELLNPKAPPFPDAEDIYYDNTSSGLAATDVQDAIDEVVLGGLFATAEQGVPVGTIEFGLWSTAPTGRLALAGQTGLLRADYPALFAHLTDEGLIVTEGTKQTHEFGNGNGTTTFSLADYRDLFPRIKSAGRALGSYQADEFKAHTHGGIPDTQGVAQSGATQYSPSITVFNQTGSTGGSETRPKNIALMATIKF